MAFDQSTRNRLQKFVNTARDSLSAEFTRQLQATYGLDPKTGTVAELSALTQLDNRQRQVARGLRETLAHYLANTPGKTQKERTQQVLERIVREQAFTVLNRLAALRMAEARGFLLESITKGYSSKGFQLYKQLAGSSLGETGDAYRHYLFGLFDEFSLDLAVLFDRYSQQGRLFPREAALLELLEQINHPDLEPLWAEDETIGWIYQYFNSQEERKKMRSESQAPRNSRELAVRNQFFTPRYVVEFLTDNTLGRIWYEMTQGKTGLVEACRYLVRRPDETLPDRALKDPRDILMLDPACGSMHFGLYAFDLFVRIYEEAWQLESELGPQAFIRSAGLQPLQATYASFEAFQVQIPKLIIERNIHGVDIDPRAVQIAGLSLWQRAQRAWQVLRVKPQARPVIRRSNIVCAEPMPGEKALLQEFTAQLYPPVLGQLVEGVFDKMQLAGEAGTLLKIEEEMQGAIAGARAQWQQQSAKGTSWDMFPAELVAATPQRELGFDLRGINDATFWDDAEQRILQALSDYASQASTQSDQKRLFADDAAKGFAFIDLCRKRFDVVLMNPPFGEPTKNSRNYLYRNYKFSTTDILIAFLERANEVATITGALSNRTPFFLQSFHDWRVSNLINKGGLRLFSDLGDGVLDAMVEAAAYTISNIWNDQSIFLDCRHEKNKENKLLSLVGNSIDSNTKDFYSQKTSAFLGLPGRPMAYWADFNDHTDSVKLGDDWGKLIRGPELFDLDIDMRCWWEVDPDSIGSFKKWTWYAKGGEFKKFSTDIHLVINRDKQEKGGLVFRRTGDCRYYFLPGLTYTQRTTNDISFRVLPEGCLTSPKGPAIITGSRDSDYALLAICNSSKIQKLINLRVGASGAAARSYDLGIIRELQIRAKTKKNIDLYSTLGRKCVELSTESDTYDEIHVDFSAENYNFNKEITECFEEYSRKIEHINSSLSILQEKTETLLGGDHNECTMGMVKKQSYIEYCKSVISIAIGYLFGRWENCNKNKESDFFSIRVASLLYNKDERKNIFEAECLIKEINRLDNNNSIFKASSDENNPFDDLNTYINKTSSGFFSEHLKKYSKSRRQAPIYWPLQTPSGSYTLWVYYHRLSEQTLYTCVNDFVEPKLKTVKDDLTGLRSKTRNSQEEKDFARLLDLEAELKDFRDELLRIAKFWKPNLNDGVQITAAPLWKLFQHKPWQKKLKETWDKLEQGDYDWAHLAYSIWPERVLRKCHQDRSLAIAHDVETDFWHEVAVETKRGKKGSGETKLEWQPIPMTDAQLHALIRAKIAGMM